MPHTDSEGLKIYYRDEGEGQPLLLIHGHTLDGRVFDSAVPGLVEHGFRVIRPDLRGHGLSERPTKGYHWSHHAQDMTAVLQHAGIQSAVIAGFSLGGGIALEMAITVPETADALALLSPVLPDRPFEERFMNNLREVARTARKEGIRKAMEGPWLMSPLFETSFRNPAVLEEARLIIMDFPGAEYLAEARDKVERTWKIPDRLGEITAPTVVAVGEDEMEGFKNFARETASGIPDGQLKEIPSAGHLWPMEHPDLLVRILIDLEKRKGRE